MKVGQLSELLKPASLDAEVVIDDADTGWLLRLKFISLCHDDNDNPIVLLGSDYGEQYK